MLKYRYKVRKGENKMTYEMEKALEYGVALEELLAMAGITPEEWGEE